MAGVPACVLRILMPMVVNTASNAAVNSASRSRMMNSMPSARQRGQQPFGRTARRSPSALDVLMMDDPLDQGPPGRPPRRVAPRAQERIAALIARRPCLHACLVSGAWVWFGRAGGEAGQADGACEQEQGAAKGVDGPDSEGVSSDSAEGQ